MSIAVVVGPGIELVAELGTVMIEEEPFSTLEPDIAERQLVKLVVAEHTAAVGQQRLAFVLEQLVVEEDPSAVEQQDFEGELASCLVLV